MRYFFHIIDGPKVFPDEGGSRLSSPELAVRQAKSLARGVTPRAAAQTLQASLPLAGPPAIDLQPAWWPSLPLIPFRITVISSP